ncbi:MAG: CocE/NonD family hydrolase, partial [Promethearchaeota archaeon]
DWFNYWLKDGGASKGKRSKFEYCSKRTLIKKRLIDAPPVKIWVLGTEKGWRYENEWPLARTKYQKLYIHSSGKANSKKGDGFLDFNAPANDEDNDTYDFDPANPVITCGGNNLYIPKGAFEQSRPESREDVLVYTSKKLEEGLEITGYLKFVLHASSSAKDTDFMIKLCDVYPDGKSYNISDMGIRVRYRDGVLNKPSLIEPDKVYRYEINLWPTSIYFRPGHRIRVDITSSDFPKYNINSNLGGQGEPGDYKIARQKIYHDKEYPSYLILPTIPVE